MNVETNIFMNSPKIMPFMKQKVIFRPEVKANIHIVGELHESTQTNQ